jgi:hypothetical protein
MQPVEFVDKVIRFRANPIIRWLLDKAAVDLTEVKLQGRFEPADYEQLLQLIGYSVDGFCDEDVSAASAEQAHRLAMGLLARRDPMAITSTERDTRWREGYTAGREALVASLRAEFPEFIDSVNKR